MVSMCWVLFKYCLFFPPPPQPCVLCTVASPISRMSKAKPRKAKQFSKVVKLFPDIQYVAGHAHIFNFMANSVDGSWGLVSANILC